MRRRLYFILPDVDSARRTADDLLLARVEDRHMRFLARRGTELDPLHEAGYLDKTDGPWRRGWPGARSHHRRACRRDGGGISAGRHEPAARRGADRHADGRAARRAWMASMAGAAVPNSRLRQFQADIEAGRVLMMATLRPRGRTPSWWRRAIRRHCPRPGDPLRLPLAVFRNGRK